MAAALRRPVASAHWREPTNICGVSPDASRTRSACEICSAWKSSSIDSTTGCGGLSTAYAAATSGGGAMQPTPEQRPILRRCQLLSGRTETDGSEDGMTYH